MKTICVYAASSDAAAPVHMEAARLLGEEIARRGFTLIYGGGSIGLMGALARAVHAAQGRVIGVIPERLNIREVSYEAADELIVTQTMRERKAIMESQADAFIMLPGGYGTLEEFFEILVLKQLHYTSKPLVIYNVAGIYDGLLQFLHDLVEGRFIKAANLRLFHVCNTPVEIFDYLAAYTPPPMESKWLQPPPLKSD